MEQVFSKENLRGLSQMFSPSSIRKLIIEEDIELFERNIKSHFKGEISLTTTNRDLIRTTYKELMKGYRCEYVYKNILLNSFLKDYPFKEIRVLDEFNIAASKADLVLLNARMKVFEIKTELDDFSRLSKQVANYQKIADEVHVVTDESSYKKALSMYRNTKVGVKFLSDENKLETVKLAGSNIDSFEFDTVFKVLRKQEYLNLTQLFYNYIPEVPNTQIFRQCYELLAEINILDFQREVISILKLRREGATAQLNSRKIPEELKFACNSLDFKAEEYETLYHFLNKTIHVPALP